MHGFGERSAHFHANNCSGQNKNRFLMCYLMWRVLTGLHTEIKIIFLPVGHTKYLPDWCFGLFKQQYRKTRMSCLNDIVCVVNTSVTPNVAQLVGIQSGEVVVPTYNWSKHFDEHTNKTSLKGITCMHHFCFIAAHPGKVFVKNDFDDTKRCITLCKDPSWVSRPTDLPEHIAPPGLSLEHQWYLYDKVMEFCEEESRFSLP